jgi:serine/threonine protein kinase
MLQLILGVKHIYDRNYAHRDITVDNVLVTDDFKVKYIDFGVSCVEKCSTPNCLNECSRWEYEYEYSGENRRSLKEYEEEKELSLQRAQQKDVQFLIFNLYNIYLGNVGFVEAQEEEDRTGIVMYIEDTWKFQEKYLISNFDDGRTSKFLKKIYGKNYDINTILDLFLEKVLAKVW